MDARAPPEVVSLPASWLATYRRLWTLLLREPTQLFLALGCMAVGAGATGGFALLTGPALRLLFTGGAAGGATGGATGGSATPGMAGTAGRFGAFLMSLPPGQARALLPLALLALTLVRAGCSYLQADRMGALTLRAVAELQESLHGKLLSLPISYFQGRHTGELFSSFGNDLGEVQRALGQGLASGLRDALQVAALVIVSAFLDIRLLLLAAVAVPLTIWPISRFARALRRISAQAQAMQAKQVAAAQEALSSAAVLHAYGAEEAALRAYGRGEDALIAVQRRSFAVRAAVTPTVELLAIVALALVLLGVASSPSAMPPEKLISFIGAVLLTYQPLKSLANSSQWIVPGLTAAERVFAVIDAAPAIADRPSARAIGRAGGALRFERVTVVYGKTDALRELDLSVRAGERVGIVGPSGAGKTTLLHLVPRLLDPSAGQLLLDGVDVREATLASLRKQIALVAQDVFLFDASVAENVGAAAPGAPTARIEAALEAAGALEFVRELPQGLQTRLGERGASLSGGQRQRLAIARALLKDAPILLLDEATSALDAVTEAQIQRALAALRVGRTVLTVAHRLSTVRDVDRLLVMDHGRIVEQGPHATLWAKGGLYRQLCDLQEGVQPG